MKKFTTILKFIYTLKYTYTHENERKIQFWKRQKEGTTNRYIWMKKNKIIIYSWRDMKCCGQKCESRVLRLRLREWMGESENKNGNETKAIFSDLSFVRPLSVLCFNLKYKTQRKYMKYSIAHAMNKNEPHTHTCINNTKEIMLLCMLRTVRFDLLIEIR